MNDPCLPRNTVHPQIPAWHPHQGSIMVDHLLAEILEALWSRGICTLYSCQRSETDRKGYILFESPWHAERFLELAAGSPDQDPNSLFQRVRQAEHSEPDSHSECWEIWTTLIDQANPHWLEGQASSRPVFNLRCSVRFPSYDLEAIRSNLQHAVSSYSAR